MKGILNTQSQETDLDKIIAARQDKTNSIQLTPALQRKLDMLEHCDDLIRMYVDRRKVITMLQKRFELSRERAIQLHRETITMYGTMRSVDKQYFIDLLLNEVMSTKDMARKKYDVKAMASCDANLIKIAERLLPDDDKKLYEDFELPVIEAGFFPELLNVEIPENLDEIVEKLKKDLKTADKIINDDGL